MAVTNIKHYDYYDNSIAAIYNMGSNLTFYTGSITQEQWTLCPYYNYIQYMCVARIPQTIA